ncbi:TPA: hypothetical protein ACXP7I_003231 [Klebsiella variicola subsp. variicola]
MRKSKVIPIKKPHIRLDQHIHGFECIRWHDRPGESALVTGFGSSPKAAYEEYLIVKKMFESDEEW